MNICIIGFGSIGQKYYNTLLENFKQCKIYVISRQDITIQTGILINDITKLPTCIDLAIIANPAPFHLESAFYFLDKNIPVLIEKPLSNTLDNITKLLKYNNVIHVGYQLKYSTIYKDTMEILPSIGKINLIKVNTGQYLPSWRTNDYKNCVSSQRKLGGGVLLELSHELDYVLAILNDYPLDIHIVKDKLSDLDMDVEDTACITLTFADAIASINIDMINRRHNRTCEIIGNLGTIMIDFLENKLYVCNTERENTIVYAKENLLLKELEYVMECIRTDNFKNTSLINAINVMKVLQNDM